MNFLLRCTLVIFLGLQLYLHPTHSYENDDLTDPRLEASRINIGYAAGQFITIDKSYLELGFSNPFMVCQDCYSFIDLNGYRFNNGKWASSIGLGIRENITDCCAFGVNAYYDYRRINCERNFHQLGVGLEWFTERLDFQINGYVPIKNRSHKCIHTFNLNVVVTNEETIFAYTGFDAGIGTQLFNYCNYSLYTALGPYYFFKHNRDDFAGVFGELQLDWQSMVSLQLRMSYDRVNAFNVQGVFQLSIPLDFSCFCEDKKYWECEGLLSRPVRRNDMILTGHSCRWSW